MGQRLRGWGEGGMEKTRVLCSTQQGRRGMRRRGKAGALQVAAHGKAAAGGAALLCKNESGQLGTRVEREREKWRLASLLLLNKSFVGAANEMERIEGWDTPRAGMK